jgi:hypothetical protein
MWRAGVGRRNITPGESIWLDGYAIRDAPSNGVAMDIFVKVIVIEDRDGHKAVWVTSDLLGFGRTMSERIAARVCDVQGIERSQFLLNASHNHSCPVVEDVLPLYHDLSERDMGVIARYSTQLEQHIHDAIDEAMGDLAPAALAFGQGLAGIAVNRRRARPNGRSLTTLTDPDVPVLTVRSSQGDLRAIVFGYAAHPVTALDAAVSGDYPGHAQAELETMFPGATAMFVAGCGADANAEPRLRPKGKLAEAYGHILAHAVDAVIEGTMQPVRGPLRTAWTPLTVHLQSPPHREQLETMLAKAVSFERRMVQYQLDKLARGEPLATEAVYPVHVWRFGDDLTFIGLTGETVCDFALRMKQAYGADATWVSGYNNELIAYVPSRRVLEEGGYEGRTGMLEYGHAAPFTSAIEETICAGVDALVEQTGGAAVMDRFIIALNKD